MAGAHPHAARSRSVLADGGDLARHRCLRAGARSARGSPAAQRRSLPSLVETDQPATTERTRPGRISIGL